MPETGASEPPAQLKTIAPYVKVATDVERHDPVVAFWVRYFAIESALKIDKDSPECKKFVLPLLEWLEEFKGKHKDNEAITNRTVAQAHVENFIMNLFNKVDSIDRAGTANKTTITMFHMAAVLFESMAVFGPLTEEVSKRAKYAKFKAVYIVKCLKLGQTPKPGPVDSSDLGDDPTADPTKTGNESGGVDGNQSTSADQKASEPKNAIGSDSGPAIGNPPEPFILTPTQPPIKTNDPPQTDASQLNEPTSSHTSSNPSRMSSGSSTINATKFHATNGAPLTVEDLLKSQKYCKFANSALQYDDISTAVANLEKALKLLKTGQHSD